MNLLLGCVGRVKQMEITLNGRASIVIIRSGRPKFWRLDRLPNDWLDFTVNNAMQVGFDGENSSLMLRSSAAAELPLKAESLQKILNKLHILSDAEVECTSGKLFDLPHRGG